VAEQVDALG